MGLVSSIIENISCYIEIVSHYNKMFSHYNKIIKHYKEIISCMCEKLKHSNNVLSCHNETICRRYEIILQYLRKHITLSCRSVGMQYFLIKYHLYITEELTYRGDRFPVKNHFTNKSPTGLNGHRSTIAQHKLVEESHICI